MSVQIMLRSVLRLLFIWPILSNHANAKRCLPLSRCQEVQWIAEKQAQLDINLDQLTCGYEEEPLVWCNVQGAIEDSTSYAIFDMIRRPTQCTGQLKVYTAMENSLQIYNFRTGRSYRNLRSLDNIYRITSLGDCCWRIHQRRGFRGPGQKISLSFDDVPPFQFLSLKSTYC